jgi:hypothetical protein
MTHDTADLFDIPELPPETPGEAQASLEASCRACTGTWAEDAGWLVRLVRDEE